MNQIFLLCTDLHLIELWKFMLHKDSLVHKLLHFCSLFAGMKIIVLIYDAKGN